MKHFNLFNGVGDHDAVAVNPVTFGNQRQRADTLKRSNHLWVLQPHFDPKYHCLISIFNNLALFEATIRAA